MLSCFANRNIGQIYSTACFCISFLSQSLLLAIRISLPFTLFISRFVLIQVYENSGTRHWFVAVVLYFCEIQGKGSALAQTDSIKAQFCRVLVLRLHTRLQRSFLSRNTSRMLKLMNAYALISHLAWFPHALSWTQQAAAIS